MEVVKRGDVAGGPGRRTSKNLRVPVESAVKVYTTGAAARVCGLSIQTIIRLFDSGALTGFKVPGSTFRRIPRPALLAFMLKHSIPLDALGDLTPEEAVAVEAAKGAAVVGPLKLTTADRLAVPA